MATQGIDVLTLTFQANGDVLPSRAVSFGGAQIAAVGAPVLGISPRPVRNKQFSDAVVLGTVPMAFGGAVSAGMQIATDVAGRAISLAAARAINADAEPFGRALEAGTLGDVKEVLLGR